MDETPQSEKQLDTGLPKPMPNPMPHNYVTYIHEWTIPQADKEETVVDPPDQKLYERRS